MARSVLLYAESSPAPIIYKSASGYLSICFMANGTRRKSPVRTKILSLSKMKSQSFGDVNLKTMPPRTKMPSNKNDGRNIFMILNLISFVLFVSSPLLQTKQL